MQAHILGQSQSQIHVLDGLACRPLDHIVNGGDDNEPAVRGSA